MAERVVRLTYFEGSAVPMVEIWAHTGEACQGVKRYDYLRTGNIPACATPEDWLETLGSSTSMLLSAIDPLSVAATSWSAFVKP